MPEKEIVKVVKMALEKMDKTYCRLSQLNYSNIDKKIKQSAKKNKYLERPIAYEFYHALRKLIDAEDVDLGENVIQGEVDKRYQHCFKKGKIPDFLKHVPKSHDQNLAVIEFKLATNLDELDSDLNKLVQFKRSSMLKYEYGIEVIVGDEKAIQSAKMSVEKVNSSNGEKIIIITFDIDSLKADDFSISYMPQEEADSTLE